MLISRKTSVRTKANRGAVDNKESEATIYLYGDIGGWFGIDHQSFIKDLNAITADTIHLRIDSAGGDVFAARAIKTAIMQHKAKVIAHIDGLAASAASFLAMGADEIEIVDGGFLMIHNAISFLDIFGYYNIRDMADLVEEITKEIGLHEKINDSIASDYVKRSGKSIDDIKKWMNDETWFTAQEAIDHKFVDRVYAGEPVEGSYDLSVFGKVPEQVAARSKNLSKRAVEKALRDAGVSNQDAKRISSAAFDEDLRDGEPVEKEQPVESVRRDVESKATKKKDRIAELLIKAEMLAPSN